MSQKAELTLKMALISTGLVQPLNSKCKSGYIEVLCRQLPGQEKGWLLVVKDLLMVAATIGFNLHICRRYVLNAEKQLAFGWHVQVDEKNSKSLDTALEAVTSALADAKPTLSALPPEKAAESKPTTPAHSRALSPGQHPQKVVHPRAPEPEDPSTWLLKEGPVEEPPERSMPRLTTIKVGRDEKGGRTSIQEMPLPHVTRDLNVPNEKGRGAKFLGGGGNS